MRGDGKQTDTPCRGNASPQKHQDSPRAPILRRFDFWEWRCARRSQDRGAVHTFGEQVSSAARQVMLADCRGSDRPTRGGQPGGQSLV